MNWVRLSCGEGGTALWWEEVPMIVGWCYNKFR